ncbi:MAG: hypothetical protein ACKO2V_13800 [Snowella sp.]
MNTNFFPPSPQTNPTIYAYQDTNPEYKRLFKIGYTIYDTVLSSRDYQESFENMR